MNQAYYDKIAEWMGYVVWLDSGRGNDLHVYIKKPGSRAPWEDTRGDIDRYTRIAFADIDPYKHMVHNRPKFDTLDAMSKAEDVVGERGLWSSYVHHLDEINCDESGDDTEMPISRVRPWLDFCFATATADQRARALCRVIDQETP